MRVRVGIEDLEGLFAIRLGVGQHLRARKLRPRDGAAARVADHGRVIADDEDGLVAEILELPELSQNDGVAEMQIRAGRIGPELDAQGPAERELLFQLGGADDLRRALGELREGLSRIDHVGRCRAERSYLFLFRSSRTSSIVRGRSCWLSAFWLLPRTRNGRV